MSSCAPRLSGRWPGRVSWRLVQRSGRPTSGRPGRRGPYGSRSPRPGSAVGWTAAVLSSPPGRRVGPGGGRQAGGPPVVAAGVSTAGGRRVSGMLPGLPSVCRRPNDFEGHALMSRNQRKNVARRGIPACASYAGPAAGSARAGKEDDPARAAVLRSAARAGTPALAAVSAERRHAGVTWVRGLARGRRRRPAARTRGPGP
jgi:hypothetical protein